MEGKSKYYILFHQNISWALPTFYKSSLHILFDKIRQKGLFLRKSSSEVLTSFWFLILTIELIKG